jgi:hypothetical protein
MKSLVLISAIWVGLGFAACKTTPTPSAPAPPKQEKQETTEASPSTPSESTESAQPGAQEQSKTSQTATPDETAPKTQASKEKPQASQAESAGATKAGTEKTDPNLSKSRPASPHTSQAKLEKARDDLRVSQVTEKRIASELEQLKKSGNASAEDIRNYETYHERVQAMVAENRKIVEKMEAAHAKHSPGKEASKSAAAGEAKKLSDPTIPEEQTQDQVAELDRQLSASLNEFDAMLLKEMESIETESAAKMRDLANVSKKKAWIWVAENPNRPMIGQNKASKAIKISRAKQAKRTHPAKKRDRRRNRVTMMMRWLPAIGPKAGAKGPPVTEEVATTKKMTISLPVSCGRLLKTKQTRS